MGPTSHASFDAIIAQLRDKIYQKYPGRSMPSFINNLPDLNGWGCWCMFDVSSQDGYGHPITDPRTVGEDDYGIDRACQILSYGYHCSLLDAEEEGDVGCVPWDVTYNASSGFGERSMHRECNRWNDNGCAYRSCMIEGHFIVSLFELLGHGARVVAEYNHANGFDREQNCLVIRSRQGGAASPGEPDCCGEYPIVFPYKRLADGTRDCCVHPTDGNGVLFNPSVMQCCDDGVTRFSCI